MTLIEILVVVGIIAILVAVIGLVGHRVKESGKKDLTRHIMDTLLSAIDEFHTATGVWPRVPNAPGRMAWNDPTPQTTTEPPYEPGEPLSLSHNNNGAYDDYYLGTPATDNFEVNVAGTYIGNQVLRSTEGMWVLLQLPYANGRLDAEAQGRIRALLGKLPETVKFNLHGGDRYRPNPIDPNAPFVEAVQVWDAWGRQEGHSPMRYRRYTYRNNNRPFLWSAGPDGKFAPDPNRVGDPAYDPNGDGADDIFSDRKD